jgi:hypothetical protein
MRRKTGMKSVKKPPQRGRKVIPLTPRRAEAESLVRFIDAHGGKLGAFRGYGARPPSDSGDAAPPRRP